MAWILGGRTESLVGTAHPENPVAGKSQVVAGLWPVLSLVTDGCDGAGFGAVAARSASCEAAQLSTDGPVKVKVATTAP